MKKYLAFLVVLITSLNLFAKAKPYVARVSRVRGEVTVLNSSKRYATVLKRGMRLKEDTSIVTGQKSFAQIIFNDQTKLNIGPNSKALIVKGNTRKDAGVVGLLKGQLRTSVKKSRSNNKNKFFIKTRNAAMAVRGTEFQTVYNPEGNLTSLLTYKGEVAMVKMNDQENKDYEVKRDDKNNVKVKQKSRKETDLKRIFQKKKSVVVKQGQFSGTVNKMDTVSLPVKINPVQLNLLYKNDGLEEKTSKRKAQIDPSDQRLAIKSFKQDAPLEGIVDKKKKIYAPKAGGFLDMSTGLYVAPSNVSKLNKKLGVYIDKDSGDINADSGEYIPPAGLKLDSEKGFVPDIKSRLKLDKKQLMAKAATLNKNSAQDVVVGEKEKVVEIKSYTPRDIFTRESLSFSFGFLEEKLFVSKDTRDSDNTFRTKESVGFGLLWTQKSFKELPLLSPFYGFSIRKIDYTHTSRRGYTQNETSLVTLKFGTKYSLNNRTNLISKVSLDQNLFLAHTSANSGNVSSLEVVTIPKVFFGIETDLLKSNRFFLNAKFLLGMNLGKTKNDFKVDPALLFDKSIGLGYWWSKSFNTKLSGFHNTTTQKVNSDYFGNDQKRRLTGGEISLTAVF